MRPDLVSRHHSGNWRLGYDVGPTTTRQPHQPIGAMYSFISSPAFLPRTYAVADAEHVRDLGLPLIARLYAIVAQDLSLVHGTASSQQDASATETPRGERLRGDHAAAASARLS